MVETMVTCSRTMTDSSSSVQPAHRSRNAMAHTITEETIYRETTTHRPPPTPLPNNMEASTRPQADWPTSSAPRCSKSSYTIPPLPIAFSSLAKPVCVGRTWNSWKRLTPPPTLRFPCSCWGVRTGGPL